MDPQGFPSEPHQGQAQWPAQNQIDIQLQGQPYREVYHNPHQRPRDLTSQTQGESNLNQIYNQGQQPWEPVPAHPVLHQNHDRDQIPQELQQYTERGNKDPSFEEPLPQARKESQANEDIDEEELAALEKQIEQEYKRFQDQRQADYAEFCLHSSLRRRGKHPDLPKYRAALLNTLHQNRGLSEQSQFQALYGINIKHYFRELKGKILAETFPGIKHQLSERTFHEIWNRPFPPFPPGGPIYQGRVAELFKFEIKIEAKFYVIIEGNLSVCQVFTESFTQATEIRQVHRFQNTEHNTVWIEAVPPPINLQILDNLWPTSKGPTSKGKRIEVKCFIHITNRVTYFYCYNFPLTPYIVPLLNPEEKDKDLAELFPTFGIDTVSVSRGFSW
ncbi:hypothetical protein OCU04_007847 [Sclerotinia nivalis]|uniref:Uncharacterized protein n=1 Tax=Sclerotinia nivalis TaxID=352851 RepID=A0A9X0AJL4_9HELO|nr:hypothetical protein OCU04_007847 [Sclerotinia nivalis]